MDVQYLARMPREIQSALDQVNPEQVEDLCDLILAARRVFVAGAGRSGLMVRAFAMRLMQMGLSVHVVGDVTTPAIAEGDLLFVGSGCGETSSLELMASKAIACKAHVGLVTASPDSTIARLAACVVHIPAPTPKSKESHSVTSVQPMASLFEQCLLVVLDTIVLLLMERKGWSGDRMLGQHANLE